MNIDRNLSNARSDAAYSRSDRRYLFGGSAAHQETVRAYHRTARRYSRALCALALADYEAEVEEAREAAEQARLVAQAEAAEAAAAEREANIETEGPMRLWQVTRPCHGGYDTYSRFVVAAPTADLARRVHPSDYARWDSATRRFVYRDGEPSEVEGYGSWLDDVDSLEVVCIGDAAEGLESGKVLCASFHAG